MTTTKLTKDHEVLTHRGTSGLTVTGIRKGDTVQVCIEQDFQTRTECTAMIGELLAYLEDVQGEEFVAECILHYRLITQKKEAMKV